RGLAVPGALRLGTDGRHHRPAAARRTGPRRLLPRRPGRLPRRLQRPLVARIRAGQEAPALGDRRPAARRGRMGRRQPVSRSLELPLRVAVAAGGRGWNRPCTHHPPRRSVPERTPMKASHTKLRRAALSLALGACLSAMAPVVVAQRVTGAVAGRATAGDQIVVNNPATGLTRTVTVGSDGSYRLGQLPIGDYDLTVMRDGQALGAPVEV